MRALFQDPAPERTVPSKTVIRNVTGSQGQRQELLIEAERILAIGIGLLDTYPDAEVIDAGGRLVLPVFVDAHAHMGKSLLGRDWYTNEVGPALPDLVDNERRYRLEQDIDFREQTGRVGRRMIAASWTSPAISVYGHSTA